MTTEEREALREQLDGLDAAAAKIEAARRPLDEARRPFDEALDAVEGVREALLERHEAEILCRCETCGTPIVFGDRAYYDGEGGVGFCADHAPTWLDVAHQWTEAAIVADQDPEDVADALEAVETHLRRGGLMSDKHVWEV